MWNKIKTQLKRFKKWIIGFLIGGIALAAGTIMLPSNEYKTINEIVSAENAYYAKYGKYLQVMLGNKLPHYETGTIKEKLGKNVPANIVIDVYETVGGENYQTKYKGYQIQYEDDTAYYSLGFGIQAKERTWTIPKPVPTPVPTASTTTL